ncbi:hypothetical protein LJC10_00695 [Selenomonadales bacterium OttesenSCG-928-I06]|nr:hypothetical protein [Selenomonadales bacterium OttesenSCG-928-I06]
MNQNIADLLLQAANQISGMQTEIEQLKTELELLQPNSEFDKLPDILTAEMVANYLKISSAAVRDLFKIAPECGGIEAFKLFTKGKDLRCKKDALKRYLEARESTNAKGATA